MATKSVSHKVSPKTAPGRITSKVTSKVVPKTTTDVKVKMNSYDPRKMYVFSLSSLLEDKPNSVEKFSDSIKIRGFAFVSLPPELVECVDRCVDEIEEFFAHGSRYKSQFLKKPIFGYFDTSHKESFRFLTGQRLSEHTIPRNFDEIQKLIDLTDKTMYRLSCICSKYLFPNIITQAKLYDIPLFNYDNYWAMFDITKYHNDGTRQRLNCEEHYDPGLLSMHLRSTRPGLQLKDETGQWITPPSDKNIAIVWAGDVATQINPKIHHGVHRVVNIKEDVGKPRIALWHEICTASQEHIEMMKTKKRYLSEIEGGSGIPISKSGR